MRDLLAGFFTIQLDYIYFIYGLSFFIFGIICLVMKDPVVYGLSWRSLGLFGLVHGFNEWLDLVNVALGDTFFFSLFRILVFIASYSFLIDFAYRNSVAPQHRRLRKTLAVLFVVLSIPGTVYAALTGNKVLLRYVLGFGGSLWAAYIISVYARSAGSRLLKKLALVLFMYSVLTGLIVQQSPFFPANILHARNFFSLSGFPIELMRALLACLGSLLVWHHYKASQGYVSAYGRWLTFSMIVLIVGGWVFVDIVGDKEGRDYKEELLVRGYIGRAAIDASRVETLTGTSADEQSLDYLFLKNKLQSISRADTDIRFVYLMCRKKGNIIFLVDAEPSVSEDYSPPGQVYVEADQVLFNKIYEGFETIRNILIPRIKQAATVLVEKKTRQELEEM